MYNINLCKNHIVLFLFIFTNLFSQIDVDSLWNVHKTADKPKQIEIERNLAFYYRTNNNLDSALILTQKVLEYAKIKSIDSLKAQSYSNLLFIYMEKDQHDLALDYSNKALEYAIKINNKILQSTILGNTAIIFGKEANFEREVEFTQRSLQIAKELDSKIDVAISYGNLATAYYAQGYHETAIKYTLKSMDLSQEINDSIGIGFMNMQMGDNYGAINKFNEASKHYEIAIKIFSKKNVPLEYANAKVSYGRLLSKNKDMLGAIKHFESAKKTFTKLNAENGEAYVYRSFTELYLKQKKYKNAKQTANIALNYYLRTGIKPDLTLTYLLLAEIKICQGELNGAKQDLNKAGILLKDITGLHFWEKFYKQKSRYFELVGNYNSAFKNQKLLMDIKDSIQNAKNIALTTDLQIKYDVEAKQKENELLLTQNKLQQLRADDSIIFRNFSILTIILLLIMAIGLYRRYRAKIQLNNKLSEANATKDKFFSIISHDLKNPFSTLLSYTDMLIADYKIISEEQRKEYLGSIQKSAKHTFNLLENLLSWSRTQRGEIKIQKTKLSVLDVVTNTYNLLLETSKNKNIELKIEVSENISINADEETISTVIRNLVSNAIKFTPENGKIKVGAWIKNHQTFIIVSDNGVGIDSNSLKSIFRLDSHHTSEGTANEKGTGLGLILCKEFMKKNGGNITVESELGSGSRFTISLPN